MEKTALILEGGAMRTTFSAGVLDVFLENKIDDFSGLFGVSAGALTGISFLSKQPGRTKDISINYINDRRYVSVTNLVFKHSMYDFDFLFHDISDELMPLDHETFQNSPCNFTAVATNCETGKTEYFEKSECEDIFAAVRASSSLPLISPMVEINGKKLLDGGITNAVPYQKAIDEGYEKLVIVLTREHGFRKYMETNTTMHVLRRFYPNYPNLIRALFNMHRMYNRERNEIDKLELEGKAFVIRPIEPITMTRVEKNTEKISALYDEGRKVCENQLEALKRFLAS